MEYCAEPFENDGSVASTLLKGLKRVMAAEFSRELSAKVALAHDRLARMGFWQGGPAPYGLRRRSVSPDGQLGLVLESGEFKGVHGHRTLLVPGPDPEVQAVRRVFRLYVRAGMTAVAIARLLNREGILAADGGVWTPVSVTRLLTNSIYIGEMAYHKTRGALGEARTRNPRKAWVRIPGVVAPIVPRSLWKAAQQARAHRSVQFSDEAMLGALERMYATYGKITHQLIRQTPGLPKGPAFVRRFGSLAAAAEAIGKPRIAEPRATRVSVPTEVILERLKALWKREGYLSGSLIDGERGLPASRTLWRRFGSLRELYLLLDYRDFDPEEFTSPVGRARAEAYAIRRARALGEIHKRAKPWSMP